MASEFVRTRAYLKKYGESVTQEIRTRLRNNGKLASGALYDSIRFEMTDTGSKVTISFHMLDYGRFVDKGVEGAESGRAGEGGRSVYKYTTKMPPREAIESWMKLKGIAMEASYPIRRYIFRFGITPTNFFTIPTTRRVKQLERGVRDAMVQDVETIIKREFGRKK